MGRPPIGRKAMTATEHQRRWRQRQRAQTAASPRSAEPDIRPEPPEFAPAPESSTAEKLIEELTRERDQARRFAVASPEWLATMKAPRALSVTNGREDVAIMLTAARNYFQLFICDECIDQISQIVAEKRSRPRGITSSCLSVTNASTR